MVSDSEAVCRDRCQETKDAYHVLGSNRHGKALTVANAVMSRGIAKIKHTGMLIEVSRLDNRILVTRSE
jgi:hypothetical protein